MNQDWKKQRTRKLTLDAELSTFDKDARTVRAVLATDKWIDGPFGPEKLSMKPGAIDLTRATGGLPLHDTHGPHVPGTFGNRIGIVENVEVLGGEMTGTLRLSRSDAGEVALTDIEDKIVRQVSIGYRVRDATPVDQGLLITEWMPMEVSIPSVVADPSATIQRGANMPDNDEQDRRTLEKEVREQVTTQIRAINQSFAPFPSAYHIRDKALAEGWDLQRANSELITFLGKAPQPTSHRADITPGQTDLEKFVQGTTQAIECRAMLHSGYRPAERKIQRENPFFGMRLTEIAREYLRIAGDDPRGDAHLIVGRAFTRAGIISHTTSDFSNILVDVANKAAQIGYEEAPETYEAWTKPGSLSDFRTHHNVKLSTFSDLEPRNEAGEFTYGTFSDFKEPNVLVNRGRLFSITREAIINDDLAQFTDVPRAMARAARRKVGDLVYAVLSTNAAMSDGNALFSAAHSNYVAAGGGGAPAKATLDAAYVAMATQTDPAGNIIKNVSAQTIIAGHSLRGTIDELMQSQFNPAEGSTTSFTAKNIWQNRLVPVYDSRIDADDAAKWYLACDPVQFDTVQVGYLNGVREPRLDRMEGFTVDGVVFRVTHDCGVAPLDWRGLYHNDGN